MFAQQLRNINLWLRPANELTNYIGFRVFPLDELTLRLFCVLTIDHLEQITMRMVFNLDELKLLKMHAVISKNG